MLTLNHPHLKLNITHGILTITDTEDNVLTLEEQPIKNFEAFYKFWNVAFNLSKNDNLATSWAFNKPFKDALTKAFKAISFEGYDNLTVSQLEALLLGLKVGDTMYGGLIFELHNTYPKLSIHP